MTVPVMIESSGGELAGDLVVPEEASGIVVFAHGSGSSRRSRRNRAVAEVLRGGGFATLLLDLLTDTEERRETASGGLRFDIELLAGRMASALEQIQDQIVVRGLPVGLFGASTGAAAALAAATENRLVRAVVSRGGRPDLAADRLAAVRVPTLLIVGSRDTQVLELNEQAATRLGGPHRIEVVPGASHLFEEPGALEQVARLATDWFGEHVRADD